MATTAILNLSPVGFPDASEQTVAHQAALTMGVAGTIPAAAADLADFYVVVPFNMTAMRLKLVSKTAPTALTTVRVRRGVPSAGLVTFSDLSATFEASIAANQKYVAADPVDVTLSEGDVLNFSITVGGGSGTNLMVEVVGKMR